MLRSVRFYSLVGDWPDSDDLLSATLAAAAFTPCTAFAEKSAGFEPPVPGLSLLARRVAGADLLRLRTQTRLLPAAALNEALEGRLAEYRERMQQEPPRKVKRQLKEKTRDELLPKALLKSQRTSALMLPAERVLAIGTASQSRAEAFIDVLRAALGSLEVRPLEFQRPFADLLTRLFTGREPRGFVIGRECRMRDPKDAGSTVRWQNVDLGEGSVQASLREGMEITHLGFEFDNAIRVVLDTHGVLSKIELPGIEKLAREQGGDAAAQGGAAIPADAFATLDAEIALYAGTLRALLKALRGALGGAESATTERERDAAA